MSVHPPQRKSRRERQRQHEDAGMRSRNRWLESGFLQQRVERTVILTVR
jgi:hypothetical protein